MGAPRWLIAPGDRLTRVRIQLIVVNDNRWQPLRIVCVQILQACAARVAVVASRHLLPESVQCSMRIPLDFGCGKSQGVAGLL